MSAERVSRGKTIVCRCEDVTWDDVQRAVATGFDDLEEVKRYTGFGTGLCQGKECMGLVACALATLTGTRDLQPFTSRPLCSPTSLAVLAAAENEAPHER
jgi:sarcosine oxidase subunit beta